MAGYVGLGDAQLETRTMPATESLRSARDVPSDLPPKAKASQPTAAQIARQRREEFIYRCVVGTWMLTLIGFGILQLMGAVRV
jgi:hypothetical protein